MSTAAEIVIVGAVVSTCALLSLGANWLHRKAARILDEMSEEVDR